MKSYWPRRSNGLPPGQRLLDEMPRFTDQPMKPIPKLPHEPTITVQVDSEHSVALTAADIEALGPRDYTFDFHCVTGWSVRDVVWRAVPLQEVFASMGIDEIPTPYVRFRGLDRGTCVLLSQDASQDNVLVATHLNDEALGDRHGGPFRLVAPDHYGYKSVKHLASIELAADLPRLRSKEHLRARAAQEERHPTLPNWAVRLPYRLMIPPTAALANRTLQRHTV